MNGPTLFGPFSLVKSEATRKLKVLGPPAPAIKPVKEFETNSSLKFASEIASFIAMAV